MENEVIEQFNKIGFWNMECVKISELQQMFYVHFRDFR